MDKLTPEKAKWLAERYYKGMEKRDASMASEFYTEDFVLQDDGAVDLVRGIKEAEAFLQNMYNTWPDLRFQLLKEPCIGIDGVTVAFLVRATSSRKSRRKFTGPTAQWEFVSFYTVDLEQEKHIDNPLEEAISKLNADIQDIRSTRTDRASACMSLEKLQEQCRQLILQIHALSRNY